MELDFFSVPQYQYSCFSKDGMSHGATYHNQNIYSISEAPPIMDYNI